MRLPFLGIQCSPNDTAHSPQAPLVTHQTVGAQLCLQAPLLLKCKDPMSPTVIHTQVGISWPATLLSSGGLSRARHLGNRTQN